MKTALGIMFLVINVLFGLGALGERDKELKKNYIYGTCFMSAVNLLVWVV